MTKNQRQKSRRLLFLVIIFLSGISTAFAQQKGSLYDDERVKTWSRDYLAGNREEVLRSVETDLRSQAPHPFAPHVWTVTQDSLGRLREVWGALSDAKLRAALGIMPDVYLLETRGESKKALQTYSPAKIAEVKDPWALNYLLFCANNESNFDAAIVYATRALRLYPNDFQAAWMTSNPFMTSEKVRLEIGKVLKFDKELANAPVGKFLQHELETLPTDNAFNNDDLAQMEIWFKQFPNDARVLRRRALVFNAFDKSEEALKNFDAATASYPFVLYWKEAADAFIQLKKPNEAEQIIARLVLLKYKDAATAQPFIELNIGSLWRRNGEIEKARKILTAAAEKWQDNDALQAELARLELDASNLQEARRFAENAAKLNQKSITNQALLMNVLQQIEDYDAALEIYKNVEQNSFEKSEDIYSRASSIYITLVQNRPNDAAQLRSEAIKVMEKAVVEFPQSGWMRRQYAFVLAESENFGDALQQLQASYAFSDPSDWGLKNNVWYVKKLQGGNAVLPELDKLVQRFPWINKTAKYENPNILPRTPKPISYPSQTEPRLVTQIGHSSAVKSIVSSPDGKLILTGSSDGTARLWQNQPSKELSGRELRQFEGHVGSVNAVAFTPDGLSAVTADDGGVVRFWNVISGSQTARFETGANVFAFAISPDGKKLVTGGANSSPRVWDISAKKELFALKGHSGSIKALAFSADGRLIVSGSSDFSARLWSGEDGKWIQSFRGHNDAVNGVALSSDNRFVLTGSSDKTARIWDARVGVDIVAQSDSPSEVLTVAFSSDGRKALSGGRRGFLIVWDAQNANVFQRLTGAETGKTLTEDIYAAIFSIDGKSILSGGGDAKARLWDTASGKALQRYEGLSDYALATAFAPDGRFFATAGYDNAIHLWDAVAGEEIKRIKGHSDRINSIAFSSDGKKIVSASHDRTVRIWDVATGKPLGEPFRHSSDISRVVFSHDNLKLLSFTTSRDGLAQLWDVSTGKLIRGFRQVADWVNSASFSPDGKYLAAPEVDGAARIFDATTGKEIYHLKDHVGVWAIAYSPDGKFVATGGLDKTVRLWNAATGEKFGQPIAKQNGTVIALAFSPDSKTLLVGSLGTRVALFDVATQNIVREFENDSANADFVRFSTDGNRAMTGNSDGLIRLWNTAQGKKISEYNRGLNTSAFDFSLAKSQFLLGGTDGTVSIGDLSNGQVLARVVSFESKTSASEEKENWAVVDNQGRFDAAYRGDIEGLHWVVGVEPIQLKQLKERFWDPQLLSKVMGFSNQEVISVESLKEVKLYPKVEEPLEVTGGILNIKLKNQGGGIGKVVVWINENEFTRDAAQTAKTTVNPNQAEAVIKLDLTNSGYKPGEENQIRVVAYPNSEELQIQSRSVSVSWRAHGKADTEPPDVYAIIGGINGYFGDNLKLKFAARDASAMAKAIEFSANNFLKEKGGKFYLAKLNDFDTDAIAPTKENFEQAFKNFASKVKPKDIFIVYLSGHGVSLKLDNENKYFYLTQKARYGEPSTLAADKALRETTTISDEELTEWTKRILAGKKVLILDTCAAGTISEKLAEGKDIPPEQQKALERTQERTGTFVLMGSTGDQPSYEASRYSQGLLTYSLLFGMRGKALRDGKYVDVSSLFRTAEDFVPKLAEGISAIQKPKVFAPKDANSFDIGMVPPNEREKIPVAMIKPVIVRPGFINSNNKRDSLSIVGKVKNLLRNAEADNKQIEFIYIDDEDFPCSIIPSGDYTVEGQNVKVDLRLSRNNQEIGKEIIEGTIDDIARKISQRVLMQAGKISAECADSPMAAK